MTPELVLQIVVALVTALAQQSQSGGGTPAQGTSAALVAAILPLLNAIIQPQAAGGQKPGSGATTASDPLAQVLQGIAGVLGKQVPDNQAGATQPQSGQAGTSAQRTPAAAATAVLQAVTPVLQQLQPTAAGQAGGSAASGGQSPQTTAASTDPIHLLLGILLGTQLSSGQAATPLAPLPSGTPSAAIGSLPVTTTSTPTPPVLTTIDKLFGGQSLAGSKTLIAVIAFVIQAILTFSGVPGISIGAGNTAGNIIATLIAAFGGLGMISKVDRVTQLLGMIATNQAPTPPSSTK